MAFRPRALTFLVGLLAVSQAGCGTASARFATPAAHPPAKAALNIAPALQVASGTESQAPPSIEGASPGAAGVSPAPSVSQDGEDELLDHPGFSIANLATEIAALRAESDPASGPQAGPQSGTAAAYRSPRVSEGNLLSLHPDADGYAALRDLIRTASRSIAIETFGFASDPVAMGLAQLLVQRKADGLAVRVLADGYKVKADAPVLKYLAEHGVSVRRYNPKLVYKLGINITHRKIYAADGVRAMTGGMNLVRRYECCVHDYLVTVRGPAARDLVAEFESDWNASGPPEQVLEPLPDGSQPPGFAPPEAPGQGRTTVVVTSRREADRAQEIRRAMTALVADARRDIVFAYPYFSDDTFVSQLKAAAARGVRVRAILPEETDESVMRVLNPLNARQVWKAGGEIRMYHSRFSHSKYFFVDGKKALLGSSNADALTFKYNQEASLLVEDPAFVAEAVARLAETDWAASRPARYEDLHLPWHQAPKGALFELFDFIL